MTSEQKYNDFINRQLFGMKAGDYYSNLIGVSGGYDCDFLDIKITAKKILPNPDEYTMSEIVEHLNFVCGFLAGCSDNGFDAISQFQNYCDRFLESYE